MAGGRFTVDAVFQAIDKFTRPIKKMQSKMQRFGEASKRALSGANRMADKVFTGFKRVGVAAAGAGVAIGGILGSVIKTGAQFEQSLVGAAVRFTGDVRKGTEAFEELKATALKVGGATEFSASEAAEGLKFLALAGLDAQQAIGALPKMVNFATSAEIELARASDVATDTMGAFGLASDDAAENAKNLQRVMDVMARSTADANMDVDQMFEAVQKGAPVAKSAGVEIEEFSSLLSVLANAGIKGAEGGTALRNAVLELAGPVPEAKKKLSELNIEVATTEDGSLDLTKTIGNLAKGTEDLGKKQKIQALSAVFGRRVIGPMITQMGSGEEVINAFAKSLNNAGGTTDEMSERLRDTTQGSMKEFSSAIDVLKIAVFDALSGALRPTIDAMTKWARANKDVIASGVKDFVTWLKDNLPEIVTWIKRIGIVAGVFFTLATAVKAVNVVVAVAIGLQKAWNAAIVLGKGIMVAFNAIVAVAKGLWIVFNVIVAANPFVLIALAIAAVIALLVFLVVKFWPEIKAFFENIGEKWMEVNQAIADFFVDIWNKIVGFFKGLWQSVSDWFAGLWKGMVDEVVRQWDVVVGVAQSVFDKFKSIWEPISEFFSSLWSGVVDQFKSQFGFIIDMISKGVNFFRGIGGEETGEEAGAAAGGAGAAAGAIPGPEGATSRFFSENVSRDEVGISIFDETGRAGVTQKPKRSRNMPHMSPSGAF